MKNIVSHNAHVNPLVLTHNGGGTIPEIVLLNDIDVVSGTNSDDITNKIIGQACRDILSVDDCDLITHSLAFSQFQHQLSSLVSAIQRLGPSQYMFAYQILQTWLKDLPVLQHLKVKSPGHCMMCVDRSLFPLLRMICNVGTKPALSVSDHTHEIIDKAV